MNYSIRQAVPNINNSISERKLPKIIMTSIFDSLKSFLLVTLLILYINSGATLFMFSYLKTSIMPPRKVECG